MRILYLLSSVQHPAVRGQLRHYHLLRALARRNGITLFALARQPVPPEAHADLASLTDECRFFPVRPTGSDGAPKTLRLRAARRRAVSSAVAAMREAFRAAADAERFDVVVFHGKRAYAAIDGFDALPVVVDGCDATSYRLGRRIRRAGITELPPLFVRFWTARRVERKMRRHQPHLAFITARDRAAVAGEDSGAAVIPNGIDVRHWTRREVDRIRDCVAFHGVMDYPPNEDAALRLIRRIMPAVRRARPGATALIVGRDPTDELVRAAAGREDVTVTGFVEDVRTYLEQATLVAAPLRYASGLQNKILEALAMELPVVTTNVVAAGLEVPGGPPPPLEVGSSDEELAARIVSLLESRERREALAVRGRRFVRDRFDWTRSAECLEELCREAMRSWRSRDRASSLASPRSLVARREAETRGRRELRRNPR